MEDKSKQLPDLRPEDLPLAEIESRALISEQIFNIAIKNTKSSDWVDFGGNPWLDTPGAERLARTFGITVAETRFEKLDRQDGDGPYYIYIWYGRVGLAKQSIWIDSIGACSSRKPFHSMEHGKRKHLEDINEMNILKDAYSNLIENGVTRFLGLRGLDWETLEKAGIVRGKAARVDFKTKGQAERPAAPAGKTQSTVSPTVEGPRTPNPPGMPNPEPPVVTPTVPSEGEKTSPPPHRKGEDKVAPEKTRQSLIDYAVTRVLATREQIEAQITNTLTIKQCNYILTNLAKMQGDISADTLGDVVRGAVYGGGA